MRPLFGIVFKHILLELTIRLSKGEKYLLVEKTTPFAGLLTTEDPNPRDIAIARNIAVVRFFLFVISPLKL